MSNIKNIKTAAKFLGLKLFEWLFEFIKLLPKRSKKAAALLLSMLILTSAFPAYALNMGDKASIERTWVSGVEYDFNNHGHYYGQLSVLKIKATGEPVYCLEPWESVNLSASATAVNIMGTAAWNSLSLSQQNIVTRASIYGYDGSSASTYGYSALEARAATQMIIWDAVLGQRTGYAHGTCAWITACTANVRNCYNAILDAMSTHANAPKFNQTSITLKGTGESNAVTITDSNGILSKFDVSSNNSNIKVSKNGNNLKIWCSANGNYSGTVTVTKQKTDIESALALTDADQVMLYGKISDPIIRSLTVKVQSLKCNVSVAKQDSENNAILDGAAFKVQQWSYSQNKYVDLKNLAATEYNGSRRYTASGLEYTDDNGGWFRNFAVKHNLICIC